MLTFEITDINNPEMTHYPINLVDFLYGKPWQAGNLEL